MRRFRVLSLVVLLCSSCLLLAATNSSDFEQPPSYPVAGVRYIVSGDFNGDGITDVATAANGTQTSTTISVLIGTKDGGFKSAVNYTVPGEVVALVVGDFNGDGNQDIAALSGNQTTGLALLFGNGNGTFQKAKSIYLPAAARVGLVAGDFNGDGILDLAFGDQLANSIGVLLGKGDGGFQSQVNYNVGAEPISLAVGDVNSDGKLDLVASNGRQEVWVLLGNGNGTFQTALSAGAGYYVTLADVNNDGTLDLLATTGSSNGLALAVELGNGDGTFQEPVLYDPVGGRSASPQVLAMVDLNGDGLPDIVMTGDEDRTMSVLLGSGGGMFLPPVEYWVGENSAAVIGGAFGSPAKAGVAVTDAEALAVDMVFANGNGTLQAPRATPGPGGGTAFAVAADLNGDGKLDVVQAVGGIIVQYGNGNDTFQAPVTVYNANPGVISVAVGDVNGDGKPDIIGAFVSGKTGSVGVLINNGDGTFAAPVFYNLPSYLNRNMLLGDFNGDGKLDIAIEGEDTNTVEILLNRGNGTFGPVIGTSVPTLPNNYYQGMVLGDFNGDGKLDVALLTETGENDYGQITVLLGKGTGGFAPYQSYGVTTSVGYSALQAADFNGDGKLDLVASYGASDETVSVLLNKGDGTFGTPTTWTVGFTPSAIAVGDFNGDGKQDIAVDVGVGSVDVSMLNGNGDGTFQPVQNLAVCAGWPYVFLIPGVFNSGRAPDLLDVCFQTDVPYSLLIVAPNLQGPH